MNTKTVPKLTLLPITAEVNKQGHLVIGGCDVVDLAEEFGRPLYLFDESTLRHRCREFINESCKYYPDTLVIYASTALLNRALALIFKEESLGLDVVSGGRTQYRPFRGFSPGQGLFSRQQQDAGRIEPCPGLDLICGRL